MPVPFDPSPAARLRVLSRAATTLGSVAALAAAAPAPTAQAAQAPKAGAMRFTEYTVSDPQFGNMRVGSLAVPEGWRVQSQVRWDFGSANYPVKVHLRAESPDGKMWIEFMPMEAVYWMSHYFQRIPVGQRSFGALHAPNFSAEQALQQFVVQPQRGRQAGFQVVGREPVDAARLAAAFKFQGHPQQVQGAQALKMRVRYTLDGAPVDEDFFTWYGGTIAIPYTGPQGTTYEYHRQLMLTHAVGAKDGLLPSVYPLLATVASSVQTDPAFISHMQRVQQHITQQFNANMQAGYDRIAAAGALSRQISANNDRMLASMQQTRVAQQQADARRRADGGSRYDAADQFSQYLRGTTRMEDPYWGTSDRDSAQRYHWTDGQGNYRASNDAGFNPNVGGNPGQSWQLMREAR